MTSRKVKHRSNSQITVKKQTLMQKPYNPLKQLKSIIHWQPVATQFMFTSQKEKKGLRNIIAASLVKLLRSHDEKKNW